MIAAKFSVSVPPKSKLPIVGGVVFILLLAIVIVFIILLKKKKAKMCFLCFKKKPAMNQGKKFVRFYQLHVATK